MANEFNVAPGAKYHVTWRLTTTESREFTGVYRGMSVIGTDTAMVFEADGVTRFLSASAIACMDQLEAAPEDASEKKKKETPSVFYG